MPSRTYEIRLSGLVPTDYLLAQVGNVDVAEQELRTVLSGRFVDQAELHGFLDRLGSLGLEVVEVRRVPVGSAGEASSSEGSRAGAEGQTPPAVEPDRSAEEGEER